MKIDLDIYQLSHSCFDLPKKTNRNNGDIMIFFKQTRKNGETKECWYVYKTNAVVEILFLKFNAVCCWEEDYNSLKVKGLIFKEFERVP